MTRSMHGDESTSSVRISRPIVLVADDEPGVRRLVRAVLFSDSYEVVEAGSGDEAWRLAQELRPAVVVLDGRMPGLAGLEVCARVRADPRLAETRLIMLTANNRRGDLEQAQLVGVDAYLTKPFSPMELLATVEHQLLGSRRPGALLITTATVAA